MEAVRALPVSVPTPPSFQQPCFGGVDGLHLSIVIPVFNGAALIRNLVQSLVAARGPHRLQVVLVNDGSADGSSLACASLAHQHPGLVTCVDLARNVGEHNAVMAGLAHARGDWCVVMDDDFQNPPEEAFRLAEAAARERRDIVFAAYPEKRHHWARNLASWAANRIARRMMDLPPRLYLASFKCLSRFALQHALAYRGPFPYLDGLVLRATRNIGVFPTVHHPSLGGSRYTLGKLFRLWAAMTINFSIQPLRLGSIMGLVLSLAGLAGAVAVVAEKLEDPSVPVGWPSLLVAVLLLSGAQLLLLGLLGEYLGQLVLTVNGTPQYVVRRVVEEGTEGGTQGV